MSTLTVLNRSNDTVFIGIECANTLKEPTNYISVEPGISRTINSISDVPSSNLYIKKDDVLVWRGTVPTGIVLTYVDGNLYHNDTLIPDILMPLDEMDNTGGGMCINYKLLWMVVIVVIVFLLFKYFNSYT